LISNPSRSSKDIDLITAEVSQLLDISSDPSILVSSGDLTILACNASMAELTGYTRNELLNFQLDTILPGIQAIRQDDSLNLELHSTQGQNLELINRRKQKTSTNVRVKALGKNRRYAVYRFAPLSKTDQSRLSPGQESIHLDGVLDLVKIFYQSNLDEALAILIRVGKDILTAESLGIYKIDSNHPQLKAVILDNPSGFLPETISTTDFFSHYKESQFSPPFKPPLSPLMERAAQNLFGGWINLLDQQVRTQIQYTFRHIFIYGVTDGFFKSSFGEPVT